MNITYGEVGLLTYIVNFLIQVNHHIAWRFISSSLLISPFILLIIAVRVKFSPRLRSYLLGACFLGLFLPFQRSVLYLSDELFLFIRHASKAVLQIPALTGDRPYDFFQVISFIWLVGFIAFYVARSLDYRKTIAMIREGRLKTCASYFYRFRSKIYLPPDIEQTYSAEEREMLLAHERQHIAQHDPFICRFLVIVECACWFNPLVSVAVKHFQHERELLCDERVTRSCSKHDYGMLILKAAENKLAARAAIAGIVIAHGSVTERVSAMVEPVRTVGKWTAAALTGLMLILLVIGFSGFQPAYKSLSEYSPAIIEGELGLKEIAVYEMNSSEAHDKLTGEAIEGMEAFITVAENGVTVDEKGMYGHAISLGLTEDTYIQLEHIYDLRLDWGRVTFAFGHLNFPVSDLKTKDKYLDYTNKEYGLSTIDKIFMALTDLFI
jgi:hypothetical protein